MPRPRKLAILALTIALSPCVAMAQLSKFADPGWNPNMETNKVSNLADKTFNTRAANMGDRSAKLGKGDLKLKSFPVKAWSTPEATGLKGRPAKLPSDPAMATKTSPYAGKTFDPGKSDVSNLQKAYPVGASKWNGQTAPGLESNRATKDFQGKTAKDLQATVDRTFHRTLTVDEVKELLNKPGSSLEPTAEVKNKDESLFGQGVGRDTRGLPLDPRVKGKSRHAAPGR